jgi:hypothetical protein
MHSYYSSIKNTLLMMSEAIVENIFTVIGAFSRMAAIIREVAMIEHELGNWKDFIEVMLRK